MVFLAAFKHIVRTAFYFTRSDYKTIIAPVLIYGLAAAAPHINFSRVPQLTLWTWLNLLQFCTGNQTSNADEDRLNKPYRPIPSGLMTVQGTRILRWVLAPVCLALSWSLDIFYPGLSLAVAFILYNDLGFGFHWLSKNLLNAMGYVSWNAGAAKFMRAGRLVESEGLQWVAPYLSAILIATTVQIQDFRDEAGDREQGHLTLPVLVPEFCRRLTSVLIACWTMGLAEF
ncbi:UbiA prenyltransferase family [Mycena rebaudengoi]|nr:UbiA prenyltransferase family [Mycena rebaudengoi]